MPISQGRGFASGDLHDITLGEQRQQIVSGLNGKYAEHALRGNLHYVSTIAAGLAVPIQSTTAPTVMLWNPSGSGVFAVLARCTVGYVSGTSVATPIGLVLKENAGDTVATGHDITAFSQSVLGTNLFNGILGKGNRSKIRSSANGTNTVVAGTYFYNMFGESALIATTAMNPYKAQFDFEGEVILPPGVAVWVGGTAASGALLAQTLSWVEVPA